MSEIFVGPDDERSSTRVPLPLTERGLKPRPMQTPARAMQRMHPLKHEIPKSFPSCQVMMSALIEWHSGTWPHSEGAESWQGTIEPGPSGGMAAGIHRTGQAISRQCTFPGAVETLWTNQGEFSAVKITHSALSTQTGVPGQSIGR